MKNRRVIYHGGISHEQEDPSIPAIYAEDTSGFEGNNDSIALAKRPLLRARLRRRLRRVNPFFQRPGENFDDYVKRREQERGYV